MKKLWLIQSQVVIQNELISEQNCSLFILSETYAGKELDMSMTVIVIIALALFVAIISLVCLARKVRNQSGYKQRYTSTAPYGVTSVPPVDPVDPPPAA